MANLELQKLRQEAREATERAREDFRAQWGHAHDATIGERTGWRRIRNGDGTVSWERDERGTDVPPAAVARAERNANRPRISYRPRGG